MNRFYGWAEQGAVLVDTGGVNSVNQVQGSFPGCTVTVYLAGTTTKPSQIYQDNLGTPTPLTNPFLASAIGYWFFYAPAGRYDVNFSGTGITTPFTLGDIAGVPQVTVGTLGAGSSQIPTPSAADKGSLALLTDNNRSLSYDIGTAWVSTNGQVYNLLDFGGVGDGATDNTTALNAAVTAIGSGNAILYIPPGTFALASSVTIPSNVATRFSDGGILAPATTKTVTINGPIQAGAYKIFAGAGTIIPTSIAGPLDVRWFGAVGDGSTDDTAAINAACTAAYAGTDQSSSDNTIIPGNHPTDSAGGTPIVVAIGIFKITGTITCYTHFDGSRATFLCFSTPTPAFLWTPGASIPPGWTGNFIDGKILLAPQLINLPLTWPTPPVGTGLKLVNLQNCTVVCQKVESFNIGIHCQGNAQGFAWNRIHLNSILNCNIGEFLEVVNPGGGGYLNENTHYGGNISWSSGSNVTGDYGIKVGTSAGSLSVSMNNNVWFRPAIEGDTPQFHIYCAGRFTQFMGVRFETSVAAPRIEYDSYLGTPFTNGCDNVITLGFPSSFNLPVVTNNGTGAARNNLIMPYAASSGGGLRHQGPELFDLVDSTHASLYIDDTNHRVGIGTVSPADLLALVPFSGAPSLNLSLGNFSYIGLTNAQLGLLLGYNAQADPVNAVSNQVIAKATDGGGVAAFIRMSDSDGGIVFHVISAPTAGNPLSNLIASIKTTGFIMNANRLQHAQGATVAAAADLTLGNDGNHFQMNVGTGTVNTIVGTNWSNGSVISFVFNASITMKHNTAGAGLRMKLSGAADFAAVADNTLTLRRDASGFWYEIGRKV